MDTGANYYLIAFSRFVRQNRLLLSGFKPEGNGATVSLGHSTPVFYGHARSLKVGSVVSKMYLSLFKLQRAVILQIIPM